MAPKIKVTGVAWLLAALDLQIFVDDIQGIHLLALVLMQTLDLDIKDGIRIYGNTFVFLQICSQLLLLLMLDRCDPVKYLAVIFKLQQLLQLIRILLIAIPDRLSQASGQAACCRIRASGGM